MTMSDLDIARSVTPRPIDDIAAELGLRPDEIAKRRGIPADSFVPKGLLDAYNEREKQMAAGVTGGHE